MNGPQRLERDLPFVLEDLYLGGMPDYRDDLVQRIAATRQRPAWMFPERWLPVDITNERATVARVPWRAVGLMALLALILAASLAVYIGSQQQQLGPVPAPFGLAENGTMVVSLDGDIVAVDQATGDITPLVTGQEIDEAPAYSPDGTKLAFRRGGAGRTQLMVADTDGSNLRAVTAEPLSLVSSWSFAPDGKALLVTGFLDGEMRIFLQPVDGGAPRVLGIPLPTGEGRLEPSTYRPPDGREILVMAAPDVGASRGIYAFDLETSELREILAPPSDGDPFGAVWSSTGDYILYDQYDPTASGFTAQSFLIAADGTDKRRIDEASGHEFDFRTSSVSNDGSRVVIQGIDSTGSVAGAPAILRIGGDGSRVEIACSIPGAPACPDSWIWSPDDSVLIGHATAEGGLTDTYVIADPTTGEVTPATISGKGAPAWQRLAPATP